MTRLQTSVERMECKGSPQSKGSKLIARYTAVDIGTTVCAVTALSASRAYQINPYKPNQPATKVPREYQGPRTAKRISAFGTDMLVNLVERVSASTYREFASKAEELNLNQVVLFTEKEFTTSLYKA